MNHLIRTISVAIMCFSNLSFAVDDFIDFETSANQLSSNYRAYIYFDGDSKYKNPIVNIADTASKYDELLADKPQLLKQWHDLIDQANRILADEGNLRNVNTQAHWEVKLGNLKRTLKEEFESGLYNTKYTDVSSNDYLRLLLLRMEKTLASYMALTNPVGGLGVSAESPDLEIKISEISTMLEAMNPQHAALKRVSKKWAFVKKILLKYNTEVAPYIVLHGYKKIRIDMNEYLASAE